MAEGETMMRLLPALLAAALIAGLLLAAPAQAGEPIDLKLSATKPYRHKPTGLIIPPVLDNIARTRASALTIDLDEFVEFETANGDEDITVYIFRHVNGSVPVWADRVAWQIEHRDVYGGAKLAAPIAAFTPPGQANPSGLIGSYAPGKGPYRSTAFAFMPLGAEWYVALRYSSVALKPDELDGRLRAVIAALQWPKMIDAQPDAAPIAYCTTPLALSGQANPVVDDNAMAAALLTSIVAIPIGSKDRKKQPPAPAIRWCQDAGRYDGLEGHGVYRPVDTTDRYLIAFGDAGVGAMSGPADGSLEEFLKVKDKDAPPNWTVTLLQLGKSSFYRRFDLLPPPDQLYAIVTREPSQSSVSSWGKNSTITINTK